MLALDTETVTTVTIDPDGHGQQPALTRILDRKRATLGLECATAILAVSGGGPEHFTNHAYDASGSIRPKDRRNSSAAGPVRKMARAIAHPLKWAGTAVPSGPPRSAWQMNHTCAVRIPIHPSAAGPVRTLPLSINSGA